MAGISPECGICNNIYDELDRKPRMLLCGHTYCQPCLQGIVSQGSPACPSCRKAIVSQVTELPVNFMLIPPSSSGEAGPRSANNKGLTCNSHQHELDFWCINCNVLICKLCLVEAHVDHKFSVTEKIFTDGNIMRNVKKLIHNNLSETNSSLDNLRLLESLPNCLALCKKSLLTQKAFLTDCSSVLSKISSEPSVEQKSNVLNVLKHQNIIARSGDVHDALQKVYDWVSQRQVSNFPHERPSQAPEGYMPDGNQWDILSSELAEKALRTLKETGHTTPKAVMRSTDGSQILCLFELLQYLAVSSSSVELELVDTAERKYPDKDNWFPLMAGGGRSTHSKHCSRLKVMVNALVDFQSSGPGSSGPSRNKVVAVLDCVNKSHDVCVVASGGVVRRDDGSWPLPLEVHVVGAYNTSQLPWLRCLLPTLYASAQPDMGECRVYLRWGSGCDYVALFSLLAELGRKFSAQHRVYLDSRHKLYGSHFRAAAEQHKIPFECLDF